MKLGQNACLDKISDDFENGSNRVKNYIIRSNHLVCFKGNIFYLILMKLGQNACLDKISDDFENRSCGVKS